MIRVRLVLSYAGRLSTESDTLDARMVALPRVGDELRVAQPDPPWGIRRSFVFRVEEIRHDASARNDVTPAVYVRAHTDEAKGC